jgi:hypothetical protein
VQPGDADDQRLAVRRPEGPPHLLVIPVGDRRRPERTDHPHRPRGVLVHVTADLGRHRDQGVGALEDHALEQPLEPDGTTGGLVQHQVVHGDRDRGAGPP